MNTCATCSYWKVGQWERERVSAGGYAEGCCRCHAPALVLTATIGQHYTEWPRTRHDDGCGDHTIILKNGVQVYV